ncbi:MAG: stress response translation initiation inhibitor YciH [Candidatus Aenigmatarchaeota archaeon]
MVNCLKCGLPKELCICETIAKEAKKIRVSVVQKRYGKYITVVSGVDTSKINIKSLMKKLKTKLACGGTFKHDAIELQGNHKVNVVKLLEKEGFPRNMIESG